MTKDPKPYLLPVAVALLMAGCTTLPPSGPGVMVLPGNGKTFDQFRFDDGDCRQFAAMQSGVTPGAAAVDSGLRSAAIGTLLGAAAGAAFNGSRGAAVGAGTGLLVGSSAGTGAASSSAYGAQRRYDFGYTQCMYAKGHRVPVSGRMMSEAPSRSGYAPPAGPVYPGQYTPPIQPPIQPPPPPPPRY